MTNLGPLPTDFEESLECARDLNDFYWVTITTNGFGYFIQGPVERTSCFPSGYNGDRSQYYSPARCPIGYTTACHSTESSETVVTCCPTQSEYRCETSTDFKWQATLGCLLEVSTNEVLYVTVVTDGGGATHQSATTLAGYQGFNAYAVQARYQSTDFASTTALGTLFTSSTITAMTKPARTPISTPESTPNDDTNTGLSAGTAAGIAIGALTGVLILVAIVWYRIRRNTRGQRQVRHDQPVFHRTNCGGYATNTYDKPPQEVGFSGTEARHELG